MADSMQFLRLDYQSQRDALIQRIQARYPGVWSDFLTGNFGVVIIDVVAWGLSTLAYTINKFAGENFISTLTRRESAVRLGNLTGYTLASASPATVLCQATISSPAAQDVTIRRGTPVKTTTQPVLTFEVTQDYTIAAGLTYPQALVVTFNPASSDALALSALLSLTNNQAFADVLDPELDLRQYVSAGQVLVVGSVTLQVTAVTVGAQPDTFNRLVLASPWSGTTDLYVGSVYERRINLVEGQTRVERYTGTGAELVCRLSNAPVIDGSVEVDVDGTEWSQVRYLAGQDLQAQVFQVKQIPAGGTLVLFGDGQSGAAVPANAVVTIAYRTGGGPDGNVAANAINATVLGQLPNGASVQVRLVNLVTGQGGALPETVETARRQIPASTATGDRAVTLSDYAALAMAWQGGYGRVSFADADVNVSDGFAGKNVVTVTAWTSGARGLEPLQEPARSALQAYLQSKACGTDFVSMVDGTVAPFPFVARVQVLPGYGVDDTADQVLAAAGAAVVATEPGGIINYATLVQAVDAVPGVGLSQVAIPSGDMVASGDSTVFATPAATAEYEVELSSGADGVFTATLPFIPRYAWTTRLTMTGQRLFVSPDVEAGYAKITGPGISDVGDSRINLATGLIEIYAVGAVARLTAVLNAVQGYDQVRNFDAFVSYDGDSSQSYRREIRQALRNWAAGLSVGQTVFAFGGDGASMTDVVENYQGVAPGTAVVRLGAPGGATREDPTSTQLPVLRRVVINGYTD